MRMFIAKEVGVYVPACRTLDLTPSLTHAATTVNLPAAMLRCAN